MRRRSFWLLLPVVAVTAVSGCGRRGPLRLPSDDAPASQRRGVVPRADEPGEDEES